MQKQFNLNNYHDISNSPKYFSHVGIKPNPAPYRLSHASGSPKFGWLHVTLVVFGWSLLWDTSHTNWTLKGEFKTRESVDWSERVIAIRLITSFAFWCRIFRLYQDFFFLPHLLKKGLVTLCNNNLLTTRKNMKHLMFFIVFSLS